ncbi:MAG: glycosyl hydrolase family 8, partial [Sutterella sp.]
MNKTLRLLSLSVLGALTSWNVMAADAPANTEAKAEAQTLVSESLPALHPVRSLKNAPTDTWPAWKEFRESALDAGRVIDRSDERLITTSEGQSYG